MAGEKISQLESLESLTGAEQFVVAKEGDNFSVQAGFVSNFMRQQASFQIIPNNVNCKFTDLSEALTLKKSLFLWRGNNITAIPILSSQITGSYIDIVYVSSYYSAQVVITTQRLREASAGQIEIAGTVTKTMIDTSLVSNDLTTTAANKVLDARQGKVLKDLIDAFPTNGTEGQILKMVGGKPTWVDPS